MNPDEQKFLNDLDKKVWTVADKLRSTLSAADKIYDGLVLMDHQDSFRFHAFKITV